MIAIKSTADVVFFPRTQKSGKILVELTSVNLENGQYKIDITDHVQYDDTYLGENEEPVTYLKTEFLLKRPTIYKQESEINALYQVLQTGISPTDDYSVKDRLIKQTLLLLYVKNDFINEQNQTIYGLNSNQWEIYIP